MTQHYWTQDLDSYSEIESLVNYTQMGSWKPHGSPGDLHEELTLPNHNLPGVFFVDEQRAGSMTARSSRPSGSRSAHIP